MENSNAKVNQAFALIANIRSSMPGGEEDINSKENENNIHDDERKRKMSHLKNEEEKLLGEFSNIFGDKKKKEPQHEIINRELLMPHRYLLTIPKFQKLLFKQFQSNLREKYSVLGKRSLYLLLFVYLIETLIIINCNIYYSNEILIFIFRGIFNFLILVTSYIYGITNWKESYTYLILGNFSFGILVNIIELYYISYKEIYFVKLVEFIFIFIIFSNLQ